MQKLNEYLSGKKHGDFAKTLGISGAYLSQILSGKRRPAIDLAFLIERETGGKVPARSWVKRDAAK